MPEKLKQLNADGYRVIFFTNQAGIEKKKTSLESVQNRIEAIISQLGIPIYVSYTLEICDLYKKIISSVSGFFFRRLFVREKINTENQLQPFLIISAETVTNQLKYGS